MQARPIFRTLITSSLFLLCSAGISSALAAEEDLQRQAEQKRESLGFLGGALGGAAIGGPPGLVVGALVGTIIGDDVNNRIARRDAETRLDDLQTAHAALARDNERLQLALEAQRNARFQQVTLQGRQQESNCCEDGAIVLHFRTGSDRLEAHYATALDDFSRMAARHPDHVIHIQGHADKRGSSSENLELSRNRISTVEAALRERGLGDMNVQRIAHGDRQTVTQNGDPEGLFFDRRVIVRIAPGNSEYLGKAGD